MGNVIWCIFIFFIIFLSIKLMFKQHFRSLNIFLLFRKLDKKSIGSLCMFLGTKIGVGSLIGTSIIIYTAGASSIIWMIIFSFLTSSIVYEEAYLGYKHRKKVGSSYISGPNYYIKNKLLKKIYTFIFLVSYTLFFLMIQTNTISEVIDINISVNKSIIFLSFLVLLTILLTTDLNNILSILNKTVILMCFLILILFGYAILKNSSDLYKCILYIFNDFFKIKSILYGLIPSLLISIKRSVFQTELLIGTTSVSASISKSSIEKTVATQVIGYYFVSLVMSILTSMLIIMYIIQSPIKADNYFELICNVFTFHFGTSGIFILIILFLLFGLTTIISAYYFGINNMKDKNKNVFRIYKLLMLICPLCGILIKEGIIWNLVDAGLLLLMIINSIEIYKLGRGKDDRERLG